MRVIRSLMLFFAVAIAAGGCAQQPVLRYQMAAAPAPQGIDNVIYGSPAPSYGAVAAPGYAIAAAPAYSVAAPAPAYAASPAYGPAVAPAYGMAAPASAYGTTGSVGMVRGYPGGMMMAQPAAYAPAAYAAPAQQWAYTLDSGDRLRVVVFGQDGLTNSYVLDASGQIAMPLIGTVPARGLTTDQLSERITDMLRQGYVREPHVVAEVEAYRPFFILGEVTAPGQREPHGGGDESPDGEPQWPAVAGQPEGDGEFEPGSDAHYRASGVNADGGRSQTVILAFWPAGMVSADRVTTGRAAGAVR